MTPESSWRVDQRWVHKRASYKVRDGLVVVLELPNKRSGVGVVEPNRFVRSGESHLWLGGVEQCTVEDVGVLCVGYFRDL